MLAETKMTMPTSKQLFCEFTTRKKFGIPSQNFVKKKVLCEKGDEITRFDGTPFTYITRPLPTRTPHPSILNYSIRHIPTELPSSKLFL